MSSAGQKNLVYMSEIQDNGYDLADKYGEKYSRYSDAEIIAILKKREHYQPDAAETAIREAIKRGIIHSEQDLLAEEYRATVPRFTLFPLPENERGKQKLGNSLLRILIISGVIPLIQGFVKIRGYETGEGVLMIVTGLAWITLAWLLHKTGKTWIAYVMLAVLACSIVYTVNHFTGKSLIKSMDLFLLAFVHVLLLYIVFYLSILIKKKQKMPGKQADL